MGVLSKAPGSGPVFSAVSVDNQQPTASSRVAEGLPLVWAGPLLRRLDFDRIVWWIAVSTPCDVRVELSQADGDAEKISAITPEVNHLQAGENLHYLLIQAPLDRKLPADAWVGYRLELKHEGQTDWIDHREYAPDICYPGKDRPGFMLSENVEAILHGSCRKPHHRGEDGLVAADRLIERMLNGDKADAAQLPAWPRLLALTGDQVYVDDVAGPMLAAIHRLIDKLGIPDEVLGCADQPELQTTADLYTCDDSFYRRHQLLPRSQRSLIESIFGGARKPVFTSDNADNHLISLGEVLAIYLLVWSPAPWSELTIDAPDNLDEPSRRRYQAEQQTIRQFVDGLPAVRRLLAHIPTAMIFDDHDVTDDWNLNRAWEALVYEHPFSRRMVGNALIAYLINQGWGNDPASFSGELISQLSAALSAPGTAGHDALIDELFRFEGWDYTWETQPPLIVLDTRTRRWRSEGRANSPSGLLDWEAVTDLQRNLRGRQSVLLVSAAPIFGVKLIEAVQRLFTLLGKPLMADSEYWMAHAGTANAILNVFSHRETPENFVVLSGDVHYSFVYDVELRGGRQPHSHIWQICSSGLRNTFPRKLLDILDIGNRWLYSPRSPLNWFTRRRRMRIVPRKPEGSARGHRLLNGTGVGIVELDATGAPWRIQQLLAASDQLVAFSREESEALWE